MTTSQSAAGDAAKARIEAAARELFSKRPVQAVRLDEIARAAGASLATIYRHYGDKQQLLDVCVLAWADLLALRMVEHLQSVSDYRERLHKTFWVVLDFFEAYPDTAPIMLNSIYSGAIYCEATVTQRTLSELLIDVLAEGREAGLLNQSVSEGVLLDYFFGVLMRLIQMHPRRANEVPLIDQHEVLFDMLWRALAEPNETSPGV